MTHKYDFNDLNNPETTAIALGLQAGIGDRLEALARMRERVAGLGQSPERYTKPTGLDYFAAMDRVFVAADSWAGYVVENPAIVHDEIAFRLACLADAFMNQLYQHMGRLQHVALGEEEKTAELDAKEAGEAKDRALDA